jgi:MoxR-like ATPase
MAPNTRPRGLMPPGVDDPESLDKALAGAGYLADTGLTTALFLALRLARPILLEGEAGVGKTEVARTLAGLYDAELIRLQCHEGIDVSQAVYEWAYARQLLHIRALEAQGAAAAAEADLYTPSFLVRRPLLRALVGDGPLERPLTGPRPPADAAVAPAPPTTRRVLLVDEIDRADDEFEAFLLEVLAEYAVTIPELGTFRADSPPVVVITSNRTREVHDALKRRCLYHWIDHPDLEREVAIVRTRLPDVTERLARQVTAFVQGIRDLELVKPPGVAETLDWAESLVTLGRDELRADGLADTLGALLKYQEDQVRVAGPELGALVQAAVERGA